MACRRLGCSEGVDCAILGVLRRRSGNSTRFRSTMRSGKDVIGLVVQGSAVQ